MPEPTFLYRPTALITGASSGFGEEFARQLAADGYNLVLVARTAEKLQSLATELRELHSAEVQVIDADLTNSLERHRVEARLVGDPPIDLLINSAGFGSSGPFAESDIENETNQVELNIIATTRLTRAVLPGMIARNRGGIINLGSIASFFPGPNSATYSATKAYVLSFTEAIHEEVSDTNINVQALCPGFVRTGFQARAHWDTGKLPERAWMTAEEVVEKSLQHLPRGPVVYVTGAHNKAIVLGSRAIPQPIKRKIAARVAR